MSYRRKFSESDSNRRHTINGLEMPATCEPSLPPPRDADPEPEREDSFTKLTPGKAVPYSDCTWESNPWRHVRRTTSLRRGVPPRLQRSMAIRATQNDESRLGWPGGFREKTLKTAYICLHSRRRSVLGLARKACSLRTTKCTTAFMTRASARIASDSSSNQCADRSLLRLKQLGQRHSGRRSPCGP